MISRRPSHIVPDIDSVYIDSRSPSPIRVCVCSLDPGRLFDRHWLFKRCSVYPTRGLPALSARIPPLYQDKHSAKPPGTIDTNRPIVIKLNFQWESKRGSLCSEKRSASELCLRDPHARASLKGRPLRDNVYNSPFCFQMKPPLVGSVSETFNLDANCVRLFLLLESVFRRSNWTLIEPHTCQLEISWCFLNSELLL